MSFFPLSSISLLNIMHHFPYPTPVAASRGICCLITSISLSNSPRASTELNIVYHCIKDINLYKIAIEQEIILFLNTNLILFSQSVQHTAQRGKIT
jgi:hypothetical protein